MLPKALSFVDVETTGLSPHHSRVIEIGIIRVEKGRLVEQYQTLVNPGTYVDPFILSMTGITSKQLEDAPSFYKISKDIKRLLTDSLFVAHNVGFDYSFLKKEFERLEESFSAKFCCSVKLSRYLFPRFQHHNLDAIISRLKLNCPLRHRAFDDAKVIWDFYQHSLKKFGTETLSLAFKNVLKRPSLPLGLSEQILDSLPEGPGVYIFYNRENAPLYIGKSKSLRARVLSHFSNSKKANIDIKIAQTISRVETVETAGELGALLLEATLIKKLKPLYNRHLRYASRLLAVKQVTTPEQYLSISICNLQDIPILELNQILGVFKSKRDLKTFLTNIAKENYLCLKLLDLENCKKNCFNFHLGLCKGACSGEEFYLKYNLRFEQAFYKHKIKDWPFKGPIAIYEKQGNGKKDVFVIDRWCVLGKLEEGKEGLEDLNKDYIFDTDTYHILQRYLKNTKFKVARLYT